MPRSPNCGVLSIVSFTHFPIKFYLFLCKCHDVNLAKRSSKFKLLSDALTRGREST